MYKKGFTLAEVLITLSIIGVVVALTIPALTRNYQETQWKSTAKKTYSELVQATSMLLIEHDGNFTGLFDLTNMDDEYCKYLKCVKQCHFLDGTWSGCFHANTEMYRLSGGEWSPGNSGHSALVLNNGILVSFYRNSTACDDTNKGFT